MKYKLGDKVIMDDDKELVGYIVGMEIDPIEEYEVSNESINGINYTVRRYASFYQYGFADFLRTDNSLTMYKE